MKVLKVVAEGVTTSFRYPHFMQQIHPTYEMPPPATIYGHICSALGEWFDPTGVRFAYHFTHEGQVTDLEHVMVLSRGKNKAKLPGTKIPKVLEGKVNPFKRALLFRPRLTLYLNRPEWESAFRSPRYAVVLGRSQDLFTYTDVSVVELEEAEQAYFEHTLLPHEMVLQTMRGITVNMPRFLDYGRNRRPAFSRYVMLTERVRLPGDGGLRFDHLTYGPYWVDPTVPRVKGVQFGVSWLRFTEDK